MASAVARALQCTLCCSRAQISAPRHGRGRKGRRSGRKCPDTGVETWTSASRGDRGVGRRGGPSKNSDNILDILWVNEQ
jgi:hypothetical protein